MSFRKPAVRGPITTWALTCLVGGVVTLGAGVTPASAQEPTTKGCSPLSVTGNRGETLKASGIQVANVSCSSTYTVTSSRISERR